MSTDISEFQYSALNKYSVLANTGITTATSPTTISTGFDYGTPAGTGITGTYENTAGTIITPNTTDVTAAVAQLGTFSGNVSLAANTFTTTSIPDAVLGVITLLPNVNYTAAGITFNGVSIKLDGGSTKNPRFFISSTSGITFTNVSAINLINGATSTNIFWTTSSSSIISFTGTTVPPSSYGIFISDTAITFAAPINIFGRLYAGTNVTFDGVGATSKVDGTVGIACYAKGTLILTEQGYVKIEDIKVGDKVVTKGNIQESKFLNEDANLETEPIIWTSSFKVTNLNSESQPICIEKDALGKDYPFEDLYVSPCHSLLLNGKMILAKNIVNGKTIYQDKECEKIEYYHLEFEHHVAIFANGVLAESYLANTNNRNMFENKISPFPKIALD